MPHAKRLEEKGGLHHLRDALAQTLAETVEFPKGVLITVVGAKVTRDTRHAKGLVSVFPVSMEKEALKTLNKSSRKIKEGLANKLRLRRIPEIHWACDETEENASAIEMAISQLKAKGEL